jgi:hypothetical protein
MFSNRAQLISADAHGQTSPQQKKVCIDLVLPPCALITSGQLTSCATKTMASAIPASLRMWPVELLHPDIFVSRYCPKRKFRRPANRAVQLASIPIFRTSVITCQFLTDLNRLGHSRLKNNIYLTWPLLVLLLKNGHMRASWCVPRSSRLCCESWGTTTALPSRWFRFYGNPQFSRARRFALTVELDRYAGFMRSRGLSPYPVRGGFLFQRSSVRSKPQSEIPVREIRKQKYIERKKFESPCPPVAAK